MGLGSVSNLSYAATSATVTFSATANNVCNISTDSGGTLAVGGNFDEVLSSENAGGSAGAVKVKCKGTGVLSVTAPSQTSAPTGFTSTATTAKVMDGASPIAEVGQNSDPIDLNSYWSGAGKPYDVHMSVTSANAILPGSYAYDVTVTITPQ